MLALEVWHNGERVCTAGVGRFGVIGAGVSHVHRSPGPHGEPGAGELTMFVGGLATDGGHPGEHRDWDVPAICVGDEVCIRVIEADAVDEPARRHTGETLVDDTLRDYYEQLKQRFEPDRSGS